MPFKPKRTVSGPRGTWELYVSKFIGVIDDQRQREFQARQAEQHLEGAERLAERTGNYAPLGDAMRNRVEHRQASGLSFLGDMLGRRKSSAVKIEAIQWGPPEEKLIWTTTSDTVERVLDEIVEGLGEGKVVQPLGAVFSGDQI